KSEIIGDIRGKGLFIGIEFVKSKRTKEPFSRTADVVKKIVQASFDKRLLVYPANAGVDGLSGDAVILAPPLTITRLEIDELVARFTTSLSKVESSLVKELL